MKSISKNNSCKIRDTFMVIRVKNKINERFLAFFSKAIVFLPIFAPDKQNISLTKQLSNEQSALGATDWNRDIKKIAIVLFLTLIYHCVLSGTLHKNKLTNAVLHGVE